MLLLTGKGPYPQKMSGTFSVFREGKYSYIKIGEDVADVQAKIPKEVYCDAGTLLTKAW
jgi:hypothetical protein